MNKNHDLLTKQIFLFASAMAFTACASGPERLLIPPLQFSGTETESQIVTRCQQEAQNIKSNHSYSQPYSNPSYGAAGAIGAAMGAGLARGYADGQARNAAFQRCLENVGYSTAYLTPEERNEYAQITTPEARIAFMNRMRIAHPSKQVLIGQSNANKPVVVPADTNPKPRPQ